VGLKTEFARAGEVRGTFTLILYSGSHSGSIETIAFLDKEDDLYTLEPFAPEFAYRIVKGVPAREALERAEGFIQMNSSFMGSRLSKIMDDRDCIIGFELRPLYQPITYGISDVLDVHYKMKDRKVIVSVSLKPSVSVSLSS
jgi:hypothetical protein